MSKFTFTSEHIKEEHEIDDKKLDTSYIPEKFPHRQELQDFLYNKVFKPLVSQNSRAEHALISGRSGTGKTAVTKAAIKEFQENSDEAITKKSEIIYVNCSRKNTYRKVFEQIAEHLGIKWKRGMGSDKNTGRIFETMNERNKDYLVVLDELDFLKKRNGRDYTQSVLYDLSRPNEVSEFDFNVNISLLCISNDERITEWVEDNESEMSYDFYNCEKYFVDEIYDILKQRYDKAFKEELLDKDAIAQLAKTVRNEYDSDIRKGLKILRNVPKVYEEGKTPEEVVKHAHVEESRNHIMKVVKSSEEHELLVLQSLISNLEQDQRTLKDILKLYEKVCQDYRVETGNDKDTKSKTFCYNSLQKFCEESLINRRKDNTKAQNPYVYYLEVDKGLLKKIVREKLEREGYSYVKADQVMSKMGDSFEQDAAEEAEDVLDDMM